MATQYNKNNSLTTPKQNYTIFEDAEGNLYKIEGEYTSEKALIEKFGPNYKGKIQGFVTEQTISAGGSLIQAAPGAGLWEHVAIIATRLTIKGLGKTTNEYLSGDHDFTGTIQPGDWTPNLARGREFIKRVGYNTAKAATKPSNIAPTGKIQGSGKLVDGLNSLYKYKKGLQEKDSKLSTFYVPGYLNPFGSSNEPIKGKISALSYGSKAEETVVGYIKGQVSGNKVENKPENKQTSVKTKQYKDFTEQDYSNLQRLIKSGLTEEAAVKEIQSKKNTRGGKDTFFKEQKDKIESIKDFKANSDGYEGFSFTTIRDRFWNTRTFKEDKELSQAAREFAHQQLAAKYGGEKNIPWDNATKEVYNDLYWTGYKNAMLARGDVIGSSPIDGVVALGLWGVAGIEDAAVGGYEYAINMTALAKDSYEATAADPVIIPGAPQIVNTGLTRLKYAFNDAVYGNPLGKYAGKTKADTAPKETNPKQTVTFSNNYASNRRIAARTAAAQPPTKGGTANAAGKSTNTKVQQTAKTESQELGMFDKLKIVTRLTISLMGQQFKSVF